MRCWHGYLSEVRRRFPSQNPIISCLILIQTGFTYLVRLTQVILEKRPLHGYSSSSSLVNFSRRLIGLIPLVDWLWCQRKIY